MSSCLSSLSVLLSVTLSCCLFWNLVLSRVSLSWSDHLSRPSLLFSSLLFSSLLFSSLLHCWPLTSQTLRPLWTADALRTVLTVPLSAAIDSWLLPSFFFFYTSLLRSSSSILSHTGSKNTNQAAGPTKKPETSFSWYCFLVDVLCPSLSFQLFYM